MKLEKIIYGNHTVLLHTLDGVLRLVPRIATESTTSRCWWQVDVNKLWKSQPNCFSHNRSVNPFPPFSRKIFKIAFDDAFGGNIEFPYAAAVGGGSCYPSLQQNHLGPRAQTFEENPLLRCGRLMSSLLNFHLSCLSSVLPSIRRFRPDPPLARTHPVQKCGNSQLVLASRWSRESHALLFCWRLFANRSINMCRIHDGHITVTFKRNGAKDDAWYV